MTRLVIVATFAAFTLMGCSSSSGTIHVIDGLTKEIYLTVPSGTKVNPGDTYVLIHTEQTTGSMDAMAGHGGHEGHAGHGGGDEPRSATARMPSSPARWSSPMPRACRAITRATG